MLILKFYLKLLMQLAEKSFFFALHCRHSKLLYYPRAQVVTVSLIFFRLWILISCICKVFHWYNCTFMNHKWQIYLGGGSGSVYFVIIYMFVIYYVVRLQFWSMNQKILRPSSFFHLLKKRCWWVSLRIATTIFIVEAFFPFTDKHWELMYQ